MRLIWRGKEVIVPDLHHELEKDRGLTYSTVKTIVDRLEEKGTTDDQPSAQRAGIIV